MRFNEGFIGYPYTNSTVYYSGGDGEERYLNSLRTQPEDWYYRSANITYEYNQYGHRSKNLSDINLDNYILFTGCSHTEGIGLELEKTFPYLVASDLEIDYYNLALGGSGIDTLTHNLVVWLNTVKKLPKALVILWPQYPRFALCENSRIQLHVPSSNNSRSDIERFFVLGEDLGFFDSVREINYKLISTLYSCNIINASFGESPPTDSNATITFADYARDLSHAGIISNKLLADDIVALLR